MSSNKSGWDWAAPKRLDTSDRSDSQPIRSPAVVSADYKPYVERRSSNDSSARGSTEDPPQEPGFAIPSSLLLSAAQHDSRRQAVAQLGVPLKAAHSGDKFDQFDGSYRSQSPGSEPWGGFQGSGLLSEMEQEQRVEVINYMQAELARKESQINSERRALDEVQVDLATAGLGVAQERRQRLSWDLVLNEKDKALQQQQQAVAQLQEHNALARDDVLAQAAAVSDLQRLHAHRGDRLASHEAALGMLGAELKEKTDQASEEWGLLESVCQSLSSPTYTAAQEMGDQNAAAQLEAHLKLTDLLAHQLSESGGPSAAEMQAHCAATEALADALQRSEDKGKSVQSKQAEMSAHLRMSEALAQTMVEIDQQKQALSLMRQQLAAERAAHAQEAESLALACTKLAEMQGAHSLCRAALCDAEQALAAHVKEVEAQRVGASEQAQRVQERQHGLEEQLWGAAKQEEELEHRSMQVAQQRTAFSALSDKLA